MKHLQNRVMCKRLCAIAASAAALLLNACTLPQQPSAPVTPVAAQWQAALPHQGNTRTLQQWWQAQADPSLLRLQDAAQSTSPNLSLALAAIAQARASSASARATLLPQVGAAVSLSRGESQPDMGVTSTAAASLQASWEIDLVGANQLVNDGAQAQLQSSQAQWHDARVALAAEVALDADLRAFNETQLKTWEIHAGAFSFPVFHAIPCLVSENPSQSIDYTLITEYPDETIYGDAFRLAHRTQLRTTLAAVRLYRERFAACAKA